MLKNTEKQDTLMEELEEICSIQKIRKSSKDVNIRMQEKMNWRK